MDDKKLANQDLDNFCIYVLSRKQHLGLSNEAFGKTVNISKGEISKIITKKRQGVSLHSFYNIAINSGDTIENARKSVYPHRNFNLKKVKTDKKDTNSRNKFGSYMKENFETDGVEYIPSKNSFDIIQQKTGITEKRLKEIYFKTGAPEPYEFLLIEKAVGKKAGEMMKEYLEKHVNRQHNLDLND
ncbi:hypothetical protein SAMN05660841_04308 [Sphingobacterium nematocida]|uniref:Uncharacterized protein n=1 Tax=Sphingobacterium nematocida TaxID=1513896 RepID=A0A1T5GS17_9SPHI|nr:hypothetical protein [Sphingobacterium nematocida]SKC11140.1 hypothetical protein SAMN05660841_04308 [Sphingobacterium nematocida]